MSNDKVVGIGTGKPVQQGEAIQNVEVYFKHEGLMESFPDVLGYQIGGGAFGVTDKNGKTTIYNWDEISSVVHEIKE